MRSFTLNWEVNKIKIKLELDNKTIIHIGADKVKISKGAVKLKEAGHISATEFEVYVLLHWVEQVEKVNHSIKTISDKLKLDQEVIEGIIEELRKKAFIQIDRGQQGYDRYQLQV